MSTPARDLLGRLDAAGVTLALDGNGNLEWQAAAEPPASLLAEARRLKPELLELLRSEAANANGAGLLSMSEIAGLVAAIAAADPIEAPDVLRRAIRAMLDAGHGRGETLQTLMPAVPLGCDPGALAIAVWDGETPPAEPAP